jgi:hypothetical protein
LISTAPPGFYAVASRNSKVRSERSAIARVNFIDSFLLDRMDADRVVPAPLAADAEFLRRVSIDLTGRIPSADRARRFLEDRAPDKRAKLIEELMSSSAFTDQWTHYFANRFEVTSGYYSYVGLRGRTLFREFLRDFVARDLSYKDVVTGMLTASGDANENAPANFLIRGWQDGDPMQDTWDTLTDRITTRFLGIKTECISCHDGRRHLEHINLYMTARKRPEFWGMSAFLSRTVFQRLNVDGFGQRARFFIQDRKTGGYSGAVNPANPGPRPARWGGPYEPRWLLDGAGAQSGDWRKEFARILTADRQFARATVNYLWAALFNVGLVDPPDAWDLARLDAKNPPPDDWPLQLHHPELLERLAGHFIESNYSIRSVIRMIVSSNAYQLSSQYDGTWRPEYTRYFARHFPRRLSPKNFGIRSLPPPEPKPRWTSPATPNRCSTPTSFPIPPSRGIISRS